MYKILKKLPYEDGSYPAIQTWSNEKLPDGYAIVPEDLNTDVFYEYNGFVVLTVENDVITAMTANAEAKEIADKKREEWLASQPPKMPTEQEIMAAAFNALLGVEE